MGIDLQTARFLLACRRHQACFRRIATIGRQTFYVRSAQVAALLAEFDIHPGANQLAEIESSSGSCADPFLRLLGAEEIVAVDVSDYEGAAVVHDMNDPIPSFLKDRFDVVYDGGSLEHVFNFPRAVANCIEMVCPGGHFIGANPANNYSGHGFYQFSPELYYRVFSQENGLRLLNLVVAEDKGPFYAVPDGAKMNRRVFFLNSQPTLAMVVAQKLSSMPLFARHPQQSFYSAAWTGSAASEEDCIPAEPTLKRLVKTVLGGVEKVAPPVRWITGPIRRFRRRRELIRTFFAGLDACPDLVALPDHSLPLPAPESRDVGQKGRADEAAF